MSSYQNRPQFNSDSTGYQSGTHSNDTALKALIIDDEVDICYLLKGILRYKNIEADYVTSLTEADKKLKDSAPPIVFLDNHLQDGLGVNYIRTVKQKFPGTKVIMVTAHDTQADRDKAFKEGVDLFIGKPFTREVIAKAIEAVTL